MPKGPWIEDTTPVNIPTTRSRAAAFLRFIAHEHIPYQDYGSDVSVFVRDVENGLNGATAEAGPSSVVLGAGTEGFRADPNDAERPTRRGGPYDAVTGGRAAEFLRTGQDPGPLLRPEDAIPQGRGTLPN